MKSVFCAKAGSTLSAVAKIAIQGAGIVIFANNPVLAASIIPAAEAIQKAVDGGTDNVAMNQMLQQGIADLVTHSSDNPAIKAEITLALSLLNFNVAKPPILSNASLIDLVDTFVAGLKAAVPVVVAPPVVVPAAVAPVA